ncbi:Glucose--fructose oxidoreductase [Usitatibacter rugosus]|uniref:Glucose--fructose oxidoreductase n=1 Tax=Usitatibacter rugosus TaxID=2732067 RepID=A0A6M4GUQ4_9PROT|nr:Gfo/Idh/MocA family oxidoreductase [Usitatibacter rugosus]QJR11050.1 Glucose--fructose oxidoreductase [Usitatibacter rugosus]
MAVKNVPKKPARERPQGHDPIRFAVVGLGFIAQASVLPAFRQAKGDAVVTALVSADAKKLKVLGKRYDAPVLATYDKYDALLASGEIDAVYIALPNTMHRDFTERAARAGIHVLCEKPLATSLLDAKAMVQACYRANVKLMTAYRLQLEPATLTAIEIVRGGDIGEPRLFTSTFSNPVKAPNIRLESDLGGGTIPDIGVYCINAARHVFQDEPIEVYAALSRSKDPRFKQVEAAASCVLRFPGDRVASFTCGFATDPQVQFEVLGTTGRLRLDDAYEIASDKVLTLSRGNHRKVTRFGKGDQFAPMLIHFADCIRGNFDPIASGEEGLRDVRIIEALYRSAKLGRPVALPAEEPPKRLRREQQIKGGPIRQVELVNARAPGG